MHIAIPGGNKTSVTRCECQKQKQIAFKLSSIPKRFSESSFANYIPCDSTQDAALRAISANFTQNFFIHGDYARGKTHLAIAQYRNLVLIEKSCMFMTMAELLAELRRAETDKDGRNDYFCQVRDRVRYAEEFHLFIDDIDKFKITEFKFEMLFDLVDTIYRRGLGLTVTSNFGLRELRDQIDGSVLRRIDDICQVVEL